MEIRPNTLPTPASIEQVQRTREGELVLIESDVQNVANDLNQVDPHLRLRFSKTAGHFVVYWKPDDEPEGNGYLVLTAEDLDQRIVQRVKQIMSPNYNFTAELDRLDKQAEKDAEHEFEERIGEQNERLAFALRKDTGRTDHRAFIPKDVEDE